jgi:uncharacterized protein involved in exopolysaccharide biosynthesis
MEQQNEDIISIDFRAFFSIIKKEFKRISIVTLLFIVVGSIYAFSLKNEFSSEGKILPELSSKSNKLGGLSSLSGLAGLAGVNLDNLSSTEAIRPDLYPDIVNNTPFYLHLLKQKVTTKEGEIMSFETYYKKESESKSWFGKFFSSDSTKKALFIAPKDSNIITLSQKQFYTIESLQKRIGASYDKKTGVISISVKMPDPVVAAVVARLTMNYITEYVTKYRTEKSRQDLVFLQDRVREARGRYYGEQSRKAQYTDQTKYIALQTADLQRERIESDYKVSTSVYNNLLAQLEQAKIKVQEETPVLQVLNPPQVPIKKSEPVRSILLIIYAFLGGIVGVLWAVFRKGNYKNILKT